ncbi:hypothetical protein N7478_001069 [Penicillium angulare]|uniref:uncharacterized protein n=1 Tax=Penicillium angulare TaxID=116970 RepID=UPI002540060A|nr:uncharacterized protein N7478_001069 [Penicillium angulare]KAJ5291818.1 hypothetical protein N7478_001069 [Penicillium angulare]
MSLFSIPVEIYAQIILYVSSIRDLAALSQSCRTLHSLCDMKTRERFDRIRIHPHDISIDKNFDLLMEILKKPRLGNYVREVQQYWRPNHNVAYVERQGQRGLRLSTDEMNIICAAVQKAGFSNSQESDVINMLMQDSTEGACGIANYSYRGIDPPWHEGIFIAQALAAIIISVSPNMETLAIARPFVSYSDFYFDAKKWPRESNIDFPLDRFLRHANVEPRKVTYLQNLRKVYMILDDADMNDSYYVGMDFLDCTTLFDRLPSIESIATDALIEDENALSRLVPRSSNISKIHLNHSSLQAPYIAQLIQSCKTLREFQYTTGGRGVVDGSFKTFNIKTFIKSICPHKNTLEVLDIDDESHMFYFSNYYSADCEEYENVEEYETVEDRLDQVIDGDVSDLDPDENDERQQFLRSFWGNNGSLREFRVLKRLGMGIGSLLYFAKGVGVGDENEKPVKLADVLPESLEHLCIRGYERGLSVRWDEQIDALKDSCESGLSNIKIVSGIEEMIPNAEDVEWPDYAEEGVLWNLKEAGYGP